MSHDDVAGGIAGANFATRDPVEAELCQVSVDTQFAFLRNNPIFSGIRWCNAVVNRRALFYGPAGRTDLHARSEIVLHAAAFSLHRRWSADA